MSETDQPVTVGRYILHRQIARGGMATIHIARLMGDEGFSRIVAAKRLHAEFAEDSDFVAMFLDEARIASKVHHRNVVPVLDVVTTQDEVLLVQEFVHGAPLHWLINKARTSKTRVPVDIAISIATQVLAGLHAAHEMVDEVGMPLHVVHRDVSPQNVMIATDGTARLLDFGVAKASMAAHTTREGTYKGKLAYSAPEQLRGSATRQSDLYSLAVLLWELIVGHRMHGAQSETELVTTVMNGTLPTITETLAGEREWGGLGDDTWAQLEALDPLIRKGLAVDLKDRFRTATEMEEALIRVIPPAATSAVASWVKDLGREYLEKNDRVIAAEETSWRRIAQPITNSRRTPVPGALRLQASTGVNAAPAGSHPPHPASRKGSSTAVAVLGSLVIAAAIVIVLLARGQTAESGPSAPSAKITPRDDTPTPETARDTENDRATAADPTATGRAAETANDPRATAADPNATATGRAAETANDPRAPATIGATETASGPRAPAADTVNAFDPPQPATATAGPGTDSRGTTATSIADPARGDAATVNRAAREPEARPTPSAPITRKPVRIAPRPTGRIVREPEPRAKPEVVAPPETTKPEAAPVPDCNPPYYFQGSKKIFKPACL